MPILFCDLDGTLVDRAATFLRWATEFAHAHNLGDDAVARLVAEDGDGMRNRAEFAAAVTECFSLPDALTDAEFMERFVTMFRSKESVLSSLRGAREAGWKIAIITNGGHWQMRKIESAGLHDFVDTICVSSVEGVAKPDPRILHIASERLGLDMEQAWMIGDSEADIGAAHGAGISSAWLSQSRAWQPRDYRPTIEAASFEEAADHAFRVHRSG